MPIDNTKLGERIRLFRTNRNLSQEELAELANSSRVFIGCLERGERTPSLETLVDLSLALNVTVDQLIGFDTKEDSHGFDSILWDCTIEEKNILTQAMKDLKATLRNYRINK